LRYPCIPDAKKQAWGADRSKTMIRRIIDNHTERSHYSNTFVKPISSPKARSVSSDFGNFLDEARINREYKQIFGTFFFRGINKLFVKDPNFVSFNADEDRKIENWENISVIERSHASPAKNSRGVSPGKRPKSPRSALVWDGLTSAFGKNVEFNIAVSSEEEPEQLPVFNVPSLHETTMTESTIPPKKISEHDYDLDRIIKL
jgi:hypothetical protein